jgi:hypothetical protein
VSAAADPLLWQMRDFARRADGSEAHMFWEVAQVDSQLLPPAVTNDVSDPRFNHAVTRTYRVAGAPPDRIVARVHIRPIDFDLIDDLVASGDLDPAIRQQVVTFTLSGTEVEWTGADGYGCRTP